MGECACELCSGRGWIVVQDGGAGRALPCSCRREAVTLVERLKRSGVWEGYLGCTRANWISEPDPWPERQLREFGRSVYLVTICGGRGSGKTHLATAILAQHLERGGDGLWREISSILAEARDAIAGSTAPMVSWYALMDERLLVLDGYGSHRATEWADSEVSRLLRYRHGRNLPTIVTVDLPSLVDLDEVDPGLSSRCGGAILIALRGGDRRITR